MHGIVDQKYTASKAPIPVPSKSFKEIFFRIDYYLEQYLQICQDRQLAIRNGAFGKAQSSQWSLMHCLTQKSNSDRAEQQDRPQIDAALSERTLLYFYEELCAAIMVALELPSSTSIADSVSVLHDCIDATKKLSVKFKDCDLISKLSDGVLLQLNEKLNQFKLYLIPYNKSLMPWAPIIDGSRILVNLQNHESLQRVLCDARVPQENITNSFNHKALWAAAPLIRKNFNEMVICKEIAEKENDSQNETSSPTDAQPNLTIMKEGGVLINEPYVCWTSSSSIVCPSKEILYRWRSTSSSAQYQDNLDDDFLRHHPDEEFRFDGDSTCASTTLIRSPSNVVKSVKDLVDIYQYRGGKKVEECRMTDNSRNESISSKFPIFPKPVRVPSIKCNELYNEICCITPSNKELEKAEEGKPSSNSEEKDGGKIDTSECAAFLASHMIDTYCQIEEAEGFDHLAAFEKARQETEKKARVITRRQNFDASYMTKSPPRTNPKPVYRGRSFKEIIALRKEAETGNTIEHFGAVDPTR